MNDVGPIRFDERLAFHLYDIDFTLTCNNAGLVVGTCNIHCHHGSTGNFENETYKNDLKSFCSKWIPTRK